jgi:hypothetical protein
LQWSSSEAHVNRLISAKGTHQLIEESTPMGVALPTNERQLRELAKAPEPAVVWAELVEKHRPAQITTSLIRDHVDQRARPVIPSAVEMHPTAPRESTSDRIVRELEEAVAAALEVATVDVVRQVVRDAIEVYVPRT